MDEEDSWLLPGLGLLGLAMLCSEAGAEEEVEVEGWLKLAALGAEQMEGHQGCIVVKTPYSDQNPSMWLEVFLHFLSGVSPAIMAADHEARGC